MFKKNINFYNDHSNRYDDNDRKCLTAGTNIGVKRHKKKKKATTIKFQLDQNLNENFYV